MVYSFSPFAFGIKAARDAQETLNRFEAVFGNQAKAAGEFADTIAREVGRSSPNSACCGR